MTALDRADWLAELWAEHVDDCSVCTDTHVGCRIGDDTDWLLLRAAGDGGRR